MDGRSIGRPPQAVGDRLAVYRVASQEPLPVTLPTLNIEAIGASIARQHAEGKRVRGTGRRRDRPPAAPARVAARPWIPAAMPPDIFAVDEPRPVPRDGARWGIPRAGGRWARRHPRWGGCLGSDHHRHGGRGRRRGRRRPQSPAGRGGVAIGTGSHRAGRRSHRRRQHCARTGCDARWEGVESRDVGRRGRCRGSRRRGRLAVALRHAIEGHACDTSEQYESDDSRDYPSSTTPCAHVSLVPHMEMDPLRKSDLPSRALINTGCPLAAASLA